ncbi:MAG: hypothetical protein HC905_11460 [Bacteroidales bacterium]|nr:hypothetical protein [Bacteroidales bacterium]
MKTKLFYLLFVVILFGNESCKKDKESDPDLCATAWSVATQDELTAVINAAMTYGNTPTVANCNAYKSAYQAYINAMKTYENCSVLTGLTRTQWEEALEEAQEELNNFTCQ